MAIYYAHTHTCRSEFFELSDDVRDLGEYLPHGYRSTYIQSIETWALKVYIYIYIYTHIHTHDERGGRLIHHINMHSHIYTHTCDTRTETEDTEHAATRQFASLP